MEQLDANLTAYVLIHLSPRDLAHVSSACRWLREPAESDVVWCTFFLQRFGSDYWGEATGPHPYKSVPEEYNEWASYPVTEVFPHFTERLARPQCLDEEDEEDQGVAGGFALNEFAKCHAYKEGYGGWKKAYKQMHEMVSVWQNPATTAFIVAGLPSFSTLSNIVDVIKQEVAPELQKKSNEYLDGEPFGPFDVDVQADILSPSGECRVVRLVFCCGSSYNDAARHLTNICVIRKPRNWYKPDETLFRGLKLINANVPLEEGLEQDYFAIYQAGRYPINNFFQPRLIYLVDGERMKTNGDAYQEMVYREFHGVLGEGKGRYAKGLPVLLAFLNVNQSLFLDRLKVPPFQQPFHMCPYYAGPVICAVTSLPVGPKSTSKNKLYVKEKLMRGVEWLCKQPSPRPHWATDGLRLCALQE